MYVTHHSGTTSVGHCSVGIVSLGELAMTCELSVQLPIGCTVALSARAEVSLECWHEAARPLLDAYEELLYVEGMLPYRGRIHDAFRELAGAIAEARKGDAAAQEIPEPEIPF